MFDMTQQILQEPYGRRLPDDTSHPTQYQNGGKVVAKFRLISEWNHNHNLVR